MTEHNEELVECGSCPRKVPLAHLDVKKGRCVECAPDGARAMDSLLLECHLGRVLHAADQGYNNGEERLSQDLERGIRGDTLADFIAVEIREVCSGEPWHRMAEVAFDAMERAKRELQGVCDELERLSYYCD